jgi:hypothetical protein
VSRIADFDDDGGMARVGALARVVSVLLALAEGACATVPLASPQEDARAKTFQGSPGTALLYVYRNETVGYSIKMDLLLNGALIGQTARKTFVLAKLRPGVHRLQSVAENTTTLQVSVDPGKVYFVWQEVAWGFMYARSRLHLVDEATGKEGVLECKLVE